MLFSSMVRDRIRAGIRFTVWLVSCYAHVFVQLKVVIVTDNTEMGCYFFVTDYCLHKVVI